MSPAARPSSSDWCCRRTPTSRSPSDPASAEEFAREHPDRQEVRIVAGVTRAGATYCALRLKAHDDDQSVVGGADLVPGLLELLSATLEDEPERERPGMSEIFDEESRDARRRNAAHDARAR